MAGGLDVISSFRLAVLYGSENPRYTVVRMETRRKYYCTVYGSGQSHSYLLVSLFRSHSVYRPTQKNKMIRPTFKLS